MQHIKQVLHDQVEKVTQFARTEMKELKKTLTGCSCPPGKLSKKAANEINLRVKRGLFLGHRPYYSTDDNTLFETDS